MTIYREFAPSAALAPFVECFWVARSGERTGATSREILLPDGTTQLILSFGGAYRRFQHADAERGERVAGSHVAGLRATGVFIEQEGGEDIFAIRFRAGGLYPFLQIPMLELVQGNLALEDAPARLADELEGRVFDAITPEQRVAAAEALLLRRLRATGAEAETRAAYVRHAVGRIYASQGRVSIDALSRELGLGYRTLDRAFNQYVGVPPKRLCRIVRFNHALLLMQQHGAGDVPWIALEAGYADQPHLIRDFREFAHATPVPFLERRYRIVEVSRPALERRLSNSFNTDR
ncbi:AraC family transcriptional regulator [Marinobacter halodurans]|uniref:AraC family transcriptional regulator n=1 Tax=Marinobacter halodurans TaxID=2528979 RepID=A0ABY1ZG42_9GAMM|nr:helix-turn-helix domain-containing protein [Marinobacter halodurans]TBW48229.1 AraC family transcriptional regulator [Marinobacter halodurans]